MKRFSIGHIGFRIMALIIAYSANVFNYFSRKIFKEAKALLQQWAIDVKSRMFAANITGLELAKEVGITNEYLSVLMHGKSSWGKVPQKTVDRIYEALNRLEAQKQAELESVPENLSLASGGA